MLGGGNADKIDKLLRKIRLGANTNAFEGGFRLWKSEHSNRPAHGDKECRPGGVSVFACPFGGRLGTQREAKGPRWPN